jgi:hypothetical protein
MHQSPYNLAFPERIHDHLPKAPLPHHGGNLSSFMFTGALQSLELPSISAACFGNIPAALGAVHPTLWATYL